MNETAGSWDSAPHQCPTCQGWHDWPGVCLRCANTKGASGASGYGAEGGDPLHFTGQDGSQCNTASGRTTSSPDWWQRRFWTLPFWMRGWELVAFILAAYVLGILLGVAL